MCPIHKEFFNLKSSCIRFEQIMEAFRRGIGGQKKEMWYWHIYGDKFHEEFQIFSSVSIKTKSLIIFFNIK